MNPPSYLCNKAALRDCFNLQIEATSEHRRAEQDLDAQQQMALFTRVMGYTAIAGIGIGIAQSC